MGKYGSDDMVVNPAPPGTDIRAELLAAEKKKIAHAIELAEEAIRSLRADDYNTALLDAQQMVSAIINASVASQMAARYGAAVVHAEERQS